MKRSVTAAVLVLGALTAAGRAQFTNLSDGRVVAGSVSFLDYGSGQTTWLADQHQAPNPGPWQDTVTVPLTTPIGNGTAGAHLESEALSVTRLAGSATASVSLTANNANMRADGWAYGRLQVVFDVTRLMQVHIDAQLNDAGAEVWIEDVNSTYLIYDRTGENAFPVSVSDTVTLGPGRWMVTAQANVSLTFAGQAGSASPSSSGTFVITALCYANCDGSTTAPVLSVNDFVCFLNRFAARDGWANCDGSTMPPELNVNDFVCFLNRFAQGCP